MITTVIIWTSVGVFRTLHEPIGCDYLHRLFLSNLIVLEVDGHMTSFFFRAFSLSVVGLDACDTNQVWALRLRYKQLLVSNWFIWPAIEEFYKAVFLLYYGCLETVYFKSKVLWPVEKLPLEIVAMGPRLSCIGDQISIEKSVDEINDSCQPSLPPFFGVYLMNLTFSNLDGLIWNLGQCPVKAYV